MNWEWSTPPFSSTRRWPKREASFRGLENRSLFGSGVHVVKRLRAAEREVRRFPDLTGLRLRHITWNDYGGQ